MHRPSHFSSRDDAVTVRNLRVLRPLVGALLLAGLVLIASLAGDRAYWRMTQAAVAFAMAGGVYAIVAGRIPSRWLIRAVIAIDLVLAAWFMSVAPHPASLLFLFLGVLLAAMSALDERAMVGCTALSVVLAFGMPAALHRKVPIDQTSIAMLITVLVVVGVLLARRAEQRALRGLRDSREQLAGAELVAGVGSWRWCPATDELEWSDNMYRLRGLDPAGEPMTMSRFWASVPADRRAALEPLLQRVIDYGEPYELLDLVALPDGSERWFHSRGARAILDGRTWVVGTVHDVTEAHRVELLKDEFAATASHELRTPATIVHGFSHTLHAHWDQLDDGQRRAMVREICDGSERMTRLIEDLLNISRIESGKLRIEPRPFDFASVIDAVCGSIDSSRVTRVVDERDHRRLVLADPERQEQILLNLVDNALAYSDGESPVEVRFRIDDDRQLAVVEVADRGIGIPVQDRERVFDRFVRLDENRNRARGTGLGLHIARELVEAQGGTIQVLGRTRGDGTVFRYTIPLAPPADAGDSTKRQSTSS